MWLVLCEANDAAALWAFRGLQERSAAPTLILGASVASASRWRHHLGDGPPEVEFTLADGRTFNSNELRGALNRLTHVHPAHVAWAEPGDRAYALQEYAALFMSWLQCLPGPVLNGPTALGLSGAWRHTSEWMVLAARAGLRTRPWRETSVRSTNSLPDPNGHRRTPLTTVIVVGSRVVGEPVSPDVQESCRRLAELAATPLLGIGLSHAADGELEFVDATPHPDLRRGGEALLDALVEALDVPG